MNIVDRGLVRCVQFGVLVGLLFACGCKTTAPLADDRPNVVLVMSDDQGWGDVGYNGNRVLKTPELDQFSKEGVRLDRFYAAGPVCSPTRGSCMTGRHPFRYGIPWAGDGFMPRDEITIAEALKTAGYATGHFGKWHIGELSKTINQSYFAEKLAHPERYSPPWENGFDECFVTESMMPTYNPYYHVGGDYGTDDYRFLQKEPVALGQRTDGFRWRDHYWTGPGEIVDEWLEGDDSKLIVDRTLEFIERKKDGPFLAVVWMHTPHTPLVAGNEDRGLYPEHPIDAQHFYGAVTAMDREIGRLRDELENKGLAENTIFWFCSDNGPSYIQDYNSAGPFRGKKSELLEGGVRVPAIISWPKRFKGGRTSAVPMVTSDIYPTILAAAGVKPARNQMEIDGIDLLAVLEGRQAERGAPIGFQSPRRGVKYDADPTQLQIAWHDGRYKLHSEDVAKTWQLYDIVADPTESKDLSHAMPQRVAEMKAALQAWQKRCATDLERHNK